MSEKKSKSVDNNEVETQIELVKNLAKVLNDAELTEIEYNLNNLNIKLVKSIPISGMRSVPTMQHVSHTVPSVPEIKEDLSKHPGVVISPMVGVAYIKPDPNSPAFVQVGEEVKEGQTLLLIEAMKVFNPIKSPKSGKVTKIFFESGMPVEFGEPLLIVE